MQNAIQTDDRLSDLYINWANSEIYEDVNYITNTMLSSGGNIKINKPLFELQHQYRIDCKFRWLSNYQNIEGSQFPIVSITCPDDIGARFEMGVGRYNGYGIYYHNSNKIYEHGGGINYH